MYPKKFLESILKGLTWTEREVLSKEESFSGAAHPLDPEGGESEEEAEAVAAPRTPRTLAKDQSGKLSADQQKKVMNMHINLGHLPVDRMLTMLKAAKAKEAVLKYVQEEFHCPNCMRQRRPVTRKVASAPRTFSFNTIIGIDVFYINFQSRTPVFLNVVDHGTNFQQIAMYSHYDGGVPSSRETWKIFQEVWVRPFGIPQTLVSDGGSEFKNQFERGLEHLGCLQVVCDASCPWQNSKTERHGGWVKDRAELELSSGQSIILQPSDLEELLVNVVCNKNRWFSRGGYSPCQLVFGVNPRIPLDLLSDDPLQEAGWDDVLNDAFDQDSATTEFRRAHAIRQKARELCVQAVSKEKIRLSANHRRHPQRQWTIGQWVFVWRRQPGTGQGHVTRSRWTGPGIVVLQSGHSVWVSMRARLWKCSSDQIRPASRDEAIGAELGRAEEFQQLIMQGQSAKAGAVDVSAEGPPPEEALSSPVPGAGPPQETVSAPETLGDDGAGHALRAQHPPVAALPGELDAEDMEWSLERRPRESLPGHETEMKRQKTDSEKTLRQSLDSASDRSIDPRQESGRVKRQISEIEELEKIALKELRRLNRLERDTKVRRDSKSSSVADSAGATSSSASSARPANAEAAAGAVSLDLQDVPGLEDIAEAEEEEQSLFPEP